MIDKICTFLTNKIRKEDLSINDEKAEIINYGLQNLIGEIPKLFIMLGVSFLLEIFRETLIAFLVLLLYRGNTGGFHLKTHIGCIVSTCLMYCGIAWFSKIVIMSDIIKYCVVGCTFAFGIMMIKLYAPADTENVPILRKKDRMRKKIASYILLTIALIISLIVKDNIVSNIIIFSHLFQTCMITRIAYKITNSKYGHEIYAI